MTLDPIAIATIGYVCNSVIDPISRGTHGYICPPGVVPPTPDRRDGDGGHGAFVIYPDDQPPVERSQIETVRMAAIAIVLIDEWHD